MRIRSLVPHSRVDESSVSRLKACWEVNGEASAAQHQAQRFGRSRLTLTLILGVDLVVPLHPLDDGVAGQEKVVRLDASVHDAELVQRTRSAHKLQHELQLRGQQVHRHRHAKVTAGFAAEHIAESDTQLEVHAQRTLD